jgi:hypothetical protein
LASLNSLSAAVDTALTNLNSAIAAFQTECNARDVTFRVANLGKPSATYEHWARYIVAAVASKPLLATILRLPPQNPAQTVAGVALPD